MDFIVAADVGIKSLAVICKRMKMSHQQECAKMKYISTLLFAVVFFTACVPVTPTPMPAKTPTISPAQATETIFFASVNATITAQIATIIAIPVATGRPRTPTVSPTPGVTFKYDSGVSAEQRREIEEAVVLARKYLGEVYNVVVYAFSDLTCVPQQPDSPDITCPNLRGNLGIATANIIELNLATESWKRSHALRVSVVAHEYAHIVQNYNGSSQIATPLGVGLGPIWLIEGGAEYLATWVVTSERITDYASAREGRINQVKKINAPLRTVEDRGGARRAGGGSEYTLGFFGTEFLARNYGGEQNILKYFRATATSRTWHDAFKETFGISRDEFYEKFEEYRRVNFPPTP